MAKNYEAPNEVRELEKLIKNFSYQNGYDTMTVFFDLLSYIIWGYSPLGPSLEWWKYTHEQNMVFYEMTQICSQITEREKKKRGWFDPFGDLFMAISSQSGKQSKGQFFTPCHIVDMMVQLVASKDTKGITMSDPCCGSGRFSLAFHYHHPDNKAHVEDIDINCCKMTVCNFLSHGVNGTVICHNSMNPNSFTAGWRVNEWIDYIRIPHVRIISEVEFRSGFSYASTVLGKKLKAIAEEVIKKNQNRLDVINRVERLFEILQDYDSQQPNNQ